MSWVIVEEFHNNVLGTLSEQDIFDKIGPSFEQVLDLKSREHPYRYVHRIAYLQALNTSNGGLCKLTLRTLLYELSAIPTELHVSVAVDYPGYKVAPIWSYDTANRGRSMFSEITRLNCDLDFKPDREFGIQGFFNIQGVEGVPCQS
jgi:hypothetical protein